MTSPRADQAPGPSLKLFAAPEQDKYQGQRPTADWTLSDVFEGAFLPLRIKPLALAESTVKLYRDALAYWVELTGDPPINQIDDYTVAQFVERLLEQPGRKSATMAIGTVRKHCTQIESLLNFVGPKTRDRTGRKNLALLALPPLVDKPDADGNPPAGDFTLAEVHAMHAAAARMRLPTVEGVTPAAWWRAFITVACYTGLRVGQLMRLEYAKLNAPWIAVTAASSKKRKGKRQYLAAEALAEIEAIRTPRERIFEFRNWEKSKRWHRTLFDRLTALAGIPKQRQFGFHGFRKLHATLVAEQSDDQTGIARAQASLGHSAASTTSGHYVNGKTQDRLVAAACERLPSPKPKAVDRQRRLFE